MIKKRKLFIVCVVVLSTFVVTTNYLLSRLRSSESTNFLDGENDLSIHQQILSLVENLPDTYKQSSANNDRIETYIKNIKSQSPVVDLGGLWKSTYSWVKSSGIVDFSSPDLGNLIWAMKNAKVIKADLTSRGTQLKLLLTLEGNQTVYFKPQWYNKDKIIDGPVYSGKDRYGSEIVAFYLSLLLEMPFAPLSTERSISLSREVFPVATQQLKNTSYVYHGRRCIYGTCFYCKREDPICENGNFTINGAVILSINGGNLKKYPSPWRRTYSSKSKAIWEDSSNYCSTVKQKLSKSRVLDLVDTSIFDFLIQNGDRHHYETLFDSVLLLDNGKGFGNPYVNHLDILAPLYQCCSLRNKTFTHIKSMTSGNLRKYLLSMPDINNLITEPHIKALENRLLIILASVEYCRNKKLKSLS